MEKRPSQSLSSVSDFSHFLGYHFSGKEAWTLLGPGVVARCVFFEGTFVFVVLYGSQEEARSHFEVR